MPRKSKRSVIRTSLPAVVLSKVEWTKAGRTLFQGNYRWLLVGLILFIVSFTLKTLNVSILFPKLPFLKSPTTTTLDYKNIPEMTDILGSDQTIRITATRKLVERLGVEQTLEILEHSPLPHTGEGHLAIHQIGFYAYQQHGLDAILHCKDYFLFGCYHGAIIEAATDQGIDAITKMTDRCKAWSSRYFQCVHAAGHTIMAMLSYDLPQTLKLCDKFYEKEKDFPDATSSCHNGAFMENLFGVHDWGKDNVAPKRDWLKDDDPYYPCTAFDDKYQKGCWLNQAARIYQMYQGDITKTVQLCEKIGNDQHTAWCIDNLARQIHPLTNANVDKVFELCGQMGNYWQDGCVIVNSGSYYSVGDPSTSISICNRHNPTAQPACFGLIMSQIMGDIRDTNQKHSLCQQMAPPYSSQCSWQVSNSTSK